VRPTFDSGLGDQHRIRDRFLLHRRPGAAEDGTTQEKGDPTEVMEFPRHISHPVEDFMEVADEAILPYHLFFGGDLRGS
jgi:hypothetical protein